MWHELLLMPTSSEISGQLGNGFHESQNALSEHDRLLMSNAVQF
jgi:hypothetical protein